jgi:hypothetical protein
MFGRKVVTPVQTGSEVETSSVVDPIASAAKYVGCVAPPGTPIYADGLREPTACFRPDHVAGVCFPFTSTVSGSGKIYFFPDFASIWVDGEATPRAQIPTDMIANRVADYQVALVDLLKAGRGGAMLAALTGVMRGSPASGDAVSSRH